MEKRKGRFSWIVLAGVACALALLFFLFDYELLRNGQTWSHRVSFSRLAFYAAVLLSLPIFSRQIKNYFIQCECLGRFKRKLCAFYLIFAAFVTGAVLYGKRLGVFPITRIGVYKFAAILLLLAVCLVFLGNRTESNFLVIGSTLSAGFVFLTPMLHALDEGGHFAEAYEVSIGRLFHVMNHPVMPVGLLQNWREVPFSRFVAQYQIPLDYTRLAKVPSILGIEPIGYPTYLYIPGAIGLWLGRHLQLSTMAEMYAGRITNLLVYLALGYLTLRILPYYKNIFAVVLLSPMTLLLSSSYSSDGIGLVCVALFIALCVRYSYAQKELHAAEYAILAISALTMVMFKGAAYALALFFVFLMPYRQLFKKDRLIKIARWAVPVLIVVVGMLFYYKLDHLPLGLGDSRGPGLNDMALQFQHMKHHPAFTMYALLNWIVSPDFGLGSYNFWSGLMNGHFFGNGGVLVFPLIFLWAFTGVTDYNSGQVCTVPARREKNLQFLYGIGTCLIIPAALYMQFSEVGSFYIFGVQSRYFIPVLPVFLMLLNSRKVSQKILDYNVAIGAALSFIIAGSLLAMSAIW